MASDRASLVDLLAPYLPAEYEQGQAHPASDELADVILDSDWLREVKAQAWDECRQAVYDRTGDDALDVEVAYASPYRKEESRG